jgi:hypothetical protein
MKKNGRTAAGAQRWKCPECRVGATAPNRRQAMLRQLGSFVARLLGGHTLREEGRSFRRGTAWCWQVDPVIPLPEAKSHVLETDGTYVNGRCLLVLMDGSTGLVVRIRWCAHESIAQYRALFHGVPAPDVLVSDGMRGMSAAARAEWPAARLQRCLVHVHRDTNRDLTHRPRSQAARELRKLSSRLFRVRTVQDAAKWGEALNAWHQRWKATANEKTTARDDPAHAAGRKWWWTHKRLRRCYKRLEKLFRDGSLFAYTDPALLAGGPVPRDHRPPRGRDQQPDQAGARRPPRHAESPHDARVRMEMLHEKPGPRPRSPARPVPRRRQAQGRKGRKGNSRGTGKDRRRARHRPWHRLERIPHQHQIPRQRRLENQT